MDRTDAAQSPLEWVEEAKESIEEKAQYEAEKLLADASSALDNMFYLFKHQIKEDVRDMLAEHIVSAVESVLISRKAGIISESKTEVYNWIVTTILAEAEAEFNSRADAMVETIMPILRSQVDLYTASAVNSKISIVTDSIKNNLYAYMNTLNNQVKTYVPEYSVATISAAGDVVNKSKADKLRAAGYVLRKVGSQGATSDINKKENLAICGEGSVITESGIFSDDIAQFGITAVLADAVYTSAGTPFYHVGIQSAFATKVYEVTYEKYDTASGKSYQAKYWRTNIPTETLLDEYRDIDEYVVIG